MTASQLKAEVDATGSVFFSRKTMRFFGDTMRNYGVRPTEVVTTLGETVLAWELFRRRAVKHGEMSSAYFRQSDLTRIRPQFTKR